ncbi:MAG: hypothetical protein Tsb009_03290 [Planctomycetaceae bacterium]
MKTKWFWSLLLAMPLAISLAGCGSKEESKSESDSDKDKKGGSVALVLPTAEKPIDQSYITDEFVGAVVVHPSRVLNSDYVKELIAVADQPGSPLAGKITSFFDVATKETGLDIHKIEEVILLLDEKGLEPKNFTGTGKFDPKTGKNVTVSKPKAVPAFIVRYGGTLDEQDLLKRIREKEKGDPEKKSHGGKTYYAVGVLAFALPDDKTLVAGDEETLKKMLTAGKTSSPLSKRLATLGAEHDIVVAFAGEKFEQKVAQSAGMTPDPEAQKYAEHLKNAKSIAITINISTSPLMTVVLGMSDDQSAGEFGDILKGEALPQLKKQYEQNKDGLKKISKEASTLADELVESLAVGSKGNDVILVVGRPSAMDRLPQVLQEALKNLAPGGPDIPGGPRE